MYKEPKKDLLLVLIISALLHLLLLIFFLLSKIGSSVSELKQKKTAPKKEAQVIYKKPKQVKRYAPKLTSGTAGFIQPVPDKPTPAEKTDQEVTEKDSSADLEESQPDKTEKPPLPFEKKSETAKEIKETKPPKPKPTEKKKTSLKQKEPQKTETPKKTVEKVEKKAPKPPVEKKKAKHLTLADITKNIFQYAQRHDVRKPVGMDHLVNITGTNYGKTTAEQLRYERYAAKLLASMRTSLLILLRKFRFIQKPTTDFMQFQFTMDLNQGGRIASLRVDKGSGSAQFDQLMLKMIHHAAEAFPPLPAFLKEYDVCAFPINYTVPTRYILSANLYAQTKQLAR